MRVGPEENGNDGRAPNNGRGGRDRDERARADARDDVRRQVRRSLRREADRSDRLVLGALVLGLGAPLYALLGWLVWRASADQPMLMSFGAFLVVLLLVNWPLKSWLDGRAWFRRKAGDGPFRTMLLKFLSLYLPLVVLVGLNDLDHGRAVSQNLREYLLSIAGYLALLVVLEVAVDAGLRRWKTWRARRAGQA